VQHVDGMKPTAQLYYIFRFLTATQTRILTRWTCFPNQ